MLEKILHSDGGEALVQAAWEHCGYFIPDMLMLDGAQGILIWRVATRPRQGIDLMDFKVHSKLSYHMAMILMRIDVSF